MGALISVAIRALISGFFTILGKDAVQAFINRIKNRKSPKPAGREGEEARSEEDC